MKRWRDGLERVLMEGIRTITRATAANEGNGVKGTRLVLLKWFARSTDALKSQSP